MNSSNKRNRKKITTLNSPSITIFLAHVNRCLRETTTLRQKTLHMHYLLAVLRTFNKLCRRHTYEHTVVIYDIRPHDSSAAVPKEKEKKRKKNHRVCQFSSNPLTYCSFDTKYFHQEGRKYSFPWISTLYLHPQCRGSHRVKHHMSRIRGSW